MMTSSHFPRLAVTTWRPESSRSHPSLTLHSKSDPRPPPRSPPPPRALASASAASLYESSTGIGSSRFGAASFASLPSPPRTAGQSARKHFASPPRTQAAASREAAEDDGRISLAAHLASLQRPTQVRESAIFLQPERVTFTAPPSGFNDCTSPGYYTADIDAYWKPSGKVQPTATFRAVGRPRVETMRHDAAFRMSMPRESQETVYRALQPPTSGLTRPTLSSRSKRRQRPSGLRYGLDTVQVRPRREPAGVEAMAPAKSPAQLAIEQASLSNRLTNSVVLPATHKALAKLEAQGRHFEAKVDYDPGLERQTAWEQANRRAAARRDAASVVAPNGSVG